MCIEVCKRCQMKHARVVVFMAPCAFHIDPKAFKKKHPRIFKRLTKAREQCWQKHNDEFHGGEDGRVQNTRD